MPKLLTIYDGHINFFEGFQNAMAQCGTSGAGPNDSFKTQLGALRKNIVQALSVSRIEDLTSINSLDTWLRLETFLFSAMTSSGYRRSLKSTYAKVVVKSPKVSRPPLQEFDKQINFLANRGFPVSEESLGVKRFLEYMRRETIDFSKPDETLKHFSKFLQKQYGLRESGQARSHKRQIKALLMASGFKFQIQEAKPMFPHLEGSIQSIKKFLLDGHGVARNLQGGVKKPLVFPKLNTKAVKAKSRFDRDRPLAPATWTKTETSLRQYLKFLEMDLGNSDFTSKSLANLTSCESFKLFLAKKYDVDAYTGHTIKTFIDSITRVCVEGWNARVGGFEAMPQGDVDARVTEMWSWYNTIADEFKKPGVREKIKDQGGLPSYKSIYESFLSALIAELQKLARQVDLLKLKSTKNQTTSSLTIAKGLSRCVEAALVITFAPRLSDTSMTIKRSSITRTESGALVLTYTPAKTSNREHPCVVKACIPDWLRPIFEVYLDHYVDIIYPHGEMLFPAIKSMKEIHNRVAVPGEKRQGNMSEQRKRLSIHFFGDDLCANDLRKILITFFGARIPEAYRYTGHKPDASRLSLTQIELDNYYYPDNHQVVENDFDIHQLISKNLGLDPQKMELISQLSKRLNPNALNTKARRAQKAVGL